MTVTAQVKTLKVDDRDVSGRGDETILEIARENGIYIPTLCHMYGLSPVGGCRLCLVEVEGVNRLLSACTTQIEEGMVVHTQSDRLNKYRKMILELLLSERNHTCSVCVSNGHCELQTLAHNAGINHVRIPYRYKRYSVDASHQLFIGDHNRCILCTRCVRVCDEIEGAHTLDILGRGIESQVITDMNEPWGESDTCTSCGKCVQVCPTGALSERGKSVAEMAKRKQFLPYLTLMRDKWK